MLGRIALWLTLVAAFALAAPAAHGQEPAPPDSAGAPVRKVPKARPKPKPRPKSRAEGERASARDRSAVSLSGNVGLQWIYDDNILRASGFTITDFMSGLYPYKFKIASYDDFILSPKVGVTIGRPLLGPRETTFRFTYTRYDYQNNPIKNNESFYFRLRQPTIGPDYVELSYTYAPQSYIRQLSDRAPFDPLTNPLQWLEFNSTRNAFELAYFRRVSERWSLRVAGTRVLRFYNQPFMENDAWDWNGGAAATLALGRAWKLTGEYGYTHSIARAADTVGETRATSNDEDPSYDRDLYQATVDWNPRGKLWIVETVELSSQYMGYYYTSTKLYWDDPFHVGRKDRVYMTEVNATTAPVWEKVNLEAGYRFTQRTSSAPGRADIGDDKDYRDARVWVGAVYPF